jgi:hypothetical protein
MAQGATPETSGSARPFKSYGKQGEFTLLAPLKPGAPRRCGSSKQSRLGDRVAPLPWHAWTWMDWRPAERGPSTLECKVSSSQSDSRLYLSELEETSSVLSTIITRGSKFLILAVERGIRRSRLARSCITPSYKPTNRH